MEFYVAIKKDDASLYILIWKDIHDLAISKKKQVTKHCYDPIYVNVCLYICIYIRTYK